VDLVLSLENDKTVIPKGNESYFFCDPAYMNSVDCTESFWKVVCYLASRHAAFTSLSLPARLDPTLQKKNRGLGHAQ